MMQTLTCTKRLSIFYKWWENFNKNIFFWTWPLPAPLESSFLTEKQSIYLSILFLGNCNFFHRRNTTLYFSLLVFSSSTFFRTILITVSVSASLSSPMRRSNVSPTLTWKLKRKQSCHFGKCRPMQTSLVWVFPKEPLPGGRYSFETVTYLSASNPCGSTWTSVPPSG